MKLLIAGVVMVLGLAACHQDPYGVAAVYKPHSGDTILAANWDDGSQRYEIAYRHSDFISFHWYCVYPPEHYSPPDDKWAVDRDCTF